MSEYVYVVSGGGLRTVGFYSPDGKWNAESDQTSDADAAKRVHYLNGGSESPLSAKLDKAMKALEEIAAYDKTSKHGSGICDYGCDCPNIAQQILKEIK